MQVAKTDSLDAAGEIIGEAFRLLGAAWHVALLYLAVRTGAGWWTEQAGVHIAFESLLNFLLSYLLMSTMLRLGGLAPDGLKGGFGSYLVVSLVSSLAIIFGILMLIIPGLYLTVRWMPALSFALVENAGVNETLRSAWEATSEKVWAILLSLAFLAVPMLLAIVMTAFAPNDGEVLPSVWSLIGTFLMAISAIAFTAVGVAVFSLVDVTGKRIAEVFG
jgi:hypothetical protein